MYKCKSELKVPNPEKLEARLEEIENEYDKHFDLVDLVNIINNSSVMTPVQHYPSHLGKVKNIKICSGYGTEGCLLKIYVSSDTQGKCLSILWVDYIPA